MYRIFTGEIPNLLSNNYTRQPLLSFNPNPNSNFIREGNNSCKTAGRLGWKTSEVSLVRSGLRIPQRAGLDPTWVWECCLVSSHSPQTCRWSPLLNCSNHLPLSKHHCSAYTGPTCLTFYRISLSSGEEVRFRCEVPAPPLERYLWHESIARQDETAPLWMPGAPDKDPAAQLTEKNKPKIFVLIPNQRQKRLI